MPLNEDIKEITSPTNFLTALVSFVIMFATSENKLVACVWFAILLVLLLAGYFLFRWIFVYRKEKTKRKPPVKRKSKRYKKKRIPLVYGSVNLSRR